MIEVISLKSPRQHQGSLWAGLSLERMGQRDLLFEIVGFPYTKEISNIRSDLLSLATT